MSLFSLYEDRMLPYILDLNQNLKRFYYEKKKKKKKKQKQKQNRFET